jgi:type I restriction-modification system DNA methylase subunit
LSLLFNIAHATVIAIEDECHHNIVTKSLMGQDIHDECNDICDMDHLFHFIAILNIINTDFKISEYNTRPIQKITIYNPPFKENSTKPPIV